MRPNITIAIPVPYLPIDDYYRITGTPTAVCAALAESNPPQHPKQIVSTASR